MHRKRRGAPFFFSSSRGLDVEQATKDGKQIILASSLPGKVTPITAGEIIAETVLHLEAEGREEDT